MTEELPNKIETNEFKQFNEIKYSEQIYVESNQLCKTEFINMNEDKKEIMRRNKNEKRRLIRMGLHKSSNRMRSEWHVQWLKENPIRCTKCGRKMKGHPRPTNSHCILEGVDFDGLKKNDEYAEMAKLGKKNNVQKYNERQKVTKYLVSLPYKKLSCEICEIEVFTSSKGVFAHVQRVHGPKKQFSCKLCSHTFISQQAVLVHKDIKHNTGDHICDKCGKILSNVRKLKVHRYLAHEKEKTVKINKDKMLNNFREDCRCNIILESCVDKIKHYKLIHLGYEQCTKCLKIVRNVDEDQHDCNKIKKVKKIPEQSFNCDDCCHVTKTKSGLDYHIKNQHKASGVVQCTLCPKYFTTKEKVKYHMKFTHKPQTACQECGKVVARIKLHMESVHKVSQYLHIG